MEADLRPAARLLAGLAVVAASGVGAVGAQQPPQAVGEILFSHAAQSITITGRILAVTAGDFDVAMTLEKVGPSGRTSTRQHGSFSLLAGEKADVATLAISMNTEDNISVDLDVLANGSVIWQVSSKTAELKK